MSSVLAMKAAEPDRITMRRASISEIDALSDIDTDASVLFDRAGLHVDFPAAHEFSVGERERLLICLRSGTVFLAVDSRGQGVGFAAVRLLDGEPYLEQLSVRFNFMRRGIGTALVEAACQVVADTGAQSLWLTTYGHLPWNRPFYERCGFESIPAPRWRLQIAEQVRYQRQWLPHPDERIVMRKSLATISPPYR